MILIHFLKEDKGLARINLGWRLKYLYRVFQLVEKRHSPHNGQEGTAGILEPAIPPGRSMPPLCVIDWSGLKFTCGNR